MLSIEHKRGDTFAPTAQFCQADGSPASLAGYVIHSQLRDAGGALVQTFDIEVTDAVAGQYRFLPVNTASWPVGALRMDIEYVQGGTTVSTETVELVIVKRVTRP